MVSSFYKRKKTCRYQGSIRSNGITVCTKDGSLRHANRCNRYDCKRWNNTPWKAFLWWNFGTIGTWRSVKQAWRERWKA